MNAEERRVGDFEEELRRRDWAALEKLSVLWQSGKIPPERVLEILALILPKDLPSSEICVRVAPFRGECRISEGCDD